MHREDNLCNTQSWSADVIQNGTITKILCGKSGFFSDYKFGKSLIYCWLLHSSKVHTLNTINLGGFLPLKKFSLIKREDLETRLAPSKPTSGTDIFKECLAVS